ncbi:MAG: hypothetical protein ACKOYM_07070, partial [Actinomycetes bacterium]
RRWPPVPTPTAGVFFLSALVVVSTLVVLTELRGVSARVDRIEQQRRDAEARAARALRLANDRHATRHFEWLRHPADELGVFVPVLLGAGALLSGLAYLIERIAGAVATSTVDRKTARLLAPDLPLHPIDISPESTRPVNGSRRAVASLATAAAVSACIGGAVLLMMVLTQNRADLATGMGSTTVVLQIQQRRSTRSVDEVATALWIACRSRLPSDVALVSVQVGRQDRVHVLLNRATGEFARRRLVGCMEDATLDRVQATVLNVGS